MIFCLQTKLQLFQEYRAVYENFFWKSSKKENPIANMVALVNINIDALKSLRKN